MKIFGERVKQTLKDGSVITNYFFVRMGKEETKNSRKSRINR